MNGAIRWSVRSAGFAAALILAWGGRGAFSAPTVSNVRASQRPGSGLVDVYYDLWGGQGAMTVAVVFSLNGGADWGMVPSQAALSGDVGAGIANGSNKHIVWNAAVDSPGVLAPQALAKVEATGQEMRLLLPGGVPLDLVRIPAGSFQMGSPDTERSRHDDEGPVHTVNIGYSYYLGKFEVTQGQWQAVTGSNPAHDYGVGDDYPVYFVSWNDCQSFVSTLNGLGLGGTFRLPSESEWEYACRAGTSTRFFFGDSLSVDDYATDGLAGTLPGNRSDYMWWWFNCQGNANGAHGSKPVGTKLPNQWGLYDMSGNVYE